MRELTELVWLWLLAPIDGSRDHALTDFLSWHGRLMFFAWGLLFPLGVLIARYFKITPRQNFPNRLDNKFWWYSHMLLQNVGGFSMIAGFAFILMERPLSWPDSFHGFLGYCLVTGGVLQVTSGYLRGSKGGPTDVDLHGDHYDMTSRRVWFERFHKTLGYVLLSAGIISVFSGLWFANAPKWMWLLITMLWIVIITVSFLCEKRGMQVSSYKAIWGTEYHASSDQ